ncbi:MAG: biopolymer transporter ExbD [Archangium sp.]|nr:biopolymer transporter ExbD [Archangium sp.]
MAGGMDLGTSKGGKKPLDAAINLVPFIDLMAVTIVFLIMTAVWTQLGRLQVSQSGQSTDEQQAPAPKQPVNLHITEKELTLSVAGAPFPSVSVTRDDKGHIDLSKLMADLAQVKKDLPDQTAITLLTEDAVRYDDLVRIIDGCIGARFPSVSVTPAST